MLSLFFALLLHCFCIAFALLLHCLCIALHDSSPELLRQRVQRAETMAPKVAVVGLKGDTVEDLEPHEGVRDERAEHCRVVQKRGGQ